MVTSRTVRVLAMLAVLSWSALAVGVAYLMGVGLAPESGPPSQRISGPRVPAPPPAPAAPRLPSRTPTAEVHAVEDSSGGSMSLVEHDVPADSRHEADSAPPAVAAPAEPQPSPARPSTPTPSPGPPPDVPPVQPPDLPRDPGEVVDEIPGLSPGNGDRPDGDPPGIVPPGRGRDPGLPPPGRG